MAAWPVQPMAAIRVCVACKAAPGHRSGDPSTIHAAAIDKALKGFIRLLRALKGSQGPYKVPKWLYKALKGLVRPLRTL